MWTSNVQPLTIPQATMQDNQQSPFLRLPPELRNRIYEDLLVSEEVVGVTSLGYHQWTPPSLLHTCHQIRSEASKLYYAANIFQICSRWHQDRLEGAFEMQEWLHALCKPQQDMLRRIRIDWTNNSFQDHLDQFYDAENIIKKYEQRQKDKSITIKKYDQHLKDNGIAIREGVVYI